MTKPLGRKIAVVAAAFVVLAAGTAVAVIVRGAREVTTTSEEAYRLYRKGLEDDRRLYKKDALAAYAKALELDPGFAMATLRLAGILADRERSRSLVQCVARNHGPLKDREEATLAIAVADVLERDHEKSAKLIRDYVRRFPDDPDGYYRLANLLMREGKGEETLATWERLLAVDPNQAAAYNALGYHFIGRGDFAKGEDYLKRYRFLAPDQANPYDSLGELYANTGRYDEAEEHLKRALEIRPDFVPAVGHLGTLEVGRGNMLAAAGWFRRAGEMAESWKERQSYSAAVVQSLLDAGQPDEALAALDGAGAAAPGTNPKEKIFARYQLDRSRAVVLALAGRTEEAEAELGRLSEFPKDLDAKEREYLEKGLAGPRAALAGARGDVEEAVRLLREILGEEKSRGAGDFPFYPSSFRLRVRLADALVSLGRPDEAREELRPVLAVNPRFAPALGVIARIEGRAGDATGPAGR